MLRVYIVEDSPIIRESLSEGLAELVGAVTVGFCESDQEAKAWLEHHAHEWDLAIVDLFLTLGHGMRVLAALSQRSSKQKVVVLSNYVSPAVRAACLKLGADKVFDKTNEIDALIDFCKILTEGNGELPSQ